MSGRGDILKPGLDVVFVGLNRAFGLEQLVVAYRALREAVPR